MRLCRDAVFRVSGFFTPPEMAVARTVSKTLYTAVCRNVMEVLLQIGAQRRTLQDGTAVFIVLDDLLDAAAEVAWAGGPDRVAREVGERFSAASIVAVAPPELSVYIRTEREANGLTRLLIHRHTQNYQVKGMNVFTSSDLPRQIIPFDVLGTAGNFAIVGAPLHETAALDDLKAFVASDQEAVIVPEKDPNETYEDFDPTTSNQSVFLADLMQAHARMLYNRTTFAGMLTRVDLSGMDSVTVLGESLFDACRSLRKVNLSYLKHLTTIEKRCFSDCNNLTSVDLRQTPRLEKIGADAFSGCSALSSVEFDASSSEALAVIDSHAFRGCKNLGEFPFDLMQKLTTLGYAAFEASGLTSLCLTNLRFLVSIGKCVNWNCAKLSRMSIEHCPLLTSIGDRAFSSCRSLRSAAVLHCPALCLSYGLFEDCYALEDIRLEGVPQLEAIQGRAFQSCFGLVSIDLTRIPSVASLGESAFCSCGSLQRVDLSGMASIQAVSSRCFAECVSLEEVNLSGIQHLCMIESEAFLGCRLLKTVKLPQNLSELKEICQRAFAGCRSLVDLDLSRATQLSTIGDACFFGCRSLAALHLSGLPRLGSVGSGAFTSCFVLSQEDMKSAAAASL